MNLQLYWHRLKSMPPDACIKYVGSRLYKVISKKALSLRDRLLDTRRRTPHLDLESPRPILRAEELKTEGINPAMAKELLHMWTSHRFDLLGSGWVRCGFYDNAPGFEGYRYPGLDLQADASGLFLEKILARQNLPQSRQIWAMIDNPAYCPIDWQKDFKSGYRWNSDVWYLKQDLADKPGGDIKVPWELSRLQHLPRMAVFSLLFPTDQNNLYHEFRNQCLDFFAQNPPRMGVNWKCTMDVGIRTANLVLAYSIFASQNFSIDPTFQNLFVRSIFEHCDHIFHNLESSSSLTSNHYLSDIAGLLFGAAFLPRSKKSEKWFRFASREVCQEITKQFYEEGSNFEGSSAYHRLSSDIAAYCAALIMGHTKAPLDSAISTRLFGAGKFIRTVTRPDGVFSQVGDNDSGLFFRLSPTGVLCDVSEAKRRYASLEGYQPEREDTVYCDENMNDARPTASALSGLFDSDSPFFDSTLYPLEHSVIQALAGDLRLQSCWVPPTITLCPAKTGLPYEKCFTIPIGGPDLTQNLQMDAFPQFGIYVFHSDRLYLLINATDNGQNGNAGHAHNDKLSFELAVDGKVLFEDPGLYVYTASADIRNAYRSVCAHNTIRTGLEQNSYLGLFAMKNETRCSLLEAGKQHIYVQATYQKIIHQRRFEITKDQIIISDFCNDPQFKFKTSTCAVTAGYGKVLRKIQEIG